MTPARAVELDGVIVVDKPAGPTSHDVVALIRRLSGVRRVGHGGTLDPFASGVLPVFLGHATRVVEYHLGDDKGYRATVAFGARSTTDDLDGELTPGPGPIPDRAAVEAALGAFRGRLAQVPPSHSAVHVAGRRAYELARGGETPVLAPRDVTITSLELTAWDIGDPDRPTAVLEIACTAGTYVRALARDIGEHLGCGAYLVALTRTRSGAFELATAHPLETVREALARGAAERVLLPPDTGLEALPAITMPPEEMAALARGQVVRPRGEVASEVAARAPHVAHGTPWRIMDEAGRLAAIARLEGGRLHPEKVFLAAAPAAAGQAAEP
ncbi:MAG TPA: tRNA pseudouridine(55) synthase TruB [Candidatus Sulfotelmatobacter sp.]|nr:tRNA pseudouridine(55) synthase TruB [Candidatus Sulfotelmatobacter sp.]